MNSDTNQNIKRLKVAITLICLAIIAIVALHIVGLHKFRGCQHRPKA